VEEITVFLQAHHNWTPIRLRSTSPRDPPIQPRHLQVDRRASHVEIPIPLRAYPGDAPIENDRRDSPIDVNIPRC
jgi:hypothetical protein